jgi:hypothetical protein
MARELRHKNQEHKNMASKIKMMKLLQECHGFAAMDQRPSPQSPAFCIPQLRPRAFQASLPIRRLNILVDPRDQARPEQPVKIIFLKPATPTAVETISSATPNPTGKSLPV